ncbi:hypothetical protein GQ43DRAFT_112356 [Delitschia confertaspora ATCC 74209]|uniref:Uncharacterized protein n=1 Tax=Delitschia confertaspora ATCC 74209 TaxID=1513339 RepID=A0A9P4MTY8_9PLEO|nr:hypothetical protein GQ43DRAFT_112356 [Delitschia confertaspora ATCC 74209]
MSHHSTPPPQKLTFPTPRVHSSLHSVDLETLIMRSSTSRYNEATENSLEDSSYEVVGESSYETSDDEGQTESLASTDAHTPDDVSSLADTDEFEDDGLDDGSQLLAASTQSTSSSYHSHSMITNGGEESMMTSKAETHLGESSHLEIEETPSNEHDELDGYGVIRQFEAPEVPEILRPYNSPEIRLSIRMALCRDFLTVSRFRILYIGEVPAWTKEDINSHIAAALTASSEGGSLASSTSSRSSRFSVVRVPSFPQGSTTNKVQLVDSSGIELIVDHCPGAHRIFSDDEGLVTTIMLDDGPNLIFGQKKAPVAVGGPDHQLPDLVVFCHNTVQAYDPLSQLERYNLGRETFKRHSIPILDIAMVRPFHKCPKAFTFSSATLRSCVEGRSDGNSDFMVIETLPVDIYSFLEITPSQLNRHLSFITKCRDGSLFGVKNTEHNEKFHQQGHLSGSKPKNESRASKAVSTLKKTSFWATIIDLAAFLVIAAVVTACFSPGGLASLYPFSPPIAKVEVTTTSTFSSQLSSATPYVKQPSISSLYQSPTPNPRAKSSPRDISVVSPEKQLGQPSNDPPSSASSELDGFKLQAMTQHNFTIAVPSCVHQMRKPPQLDIRVIRDSEAIPIRVSKLAGGNITITLEREYPFGIFEVEVRTKSKPLLTDKFTVALGLRSYNLFSLRETMGRLSQNVRCDIAAAQVNLKNISSQISKTVHTSLTRVEEGAMTVFDQTKHWKHHVRKSTQSIAEHLHDATHEAVRQLSIGTRITKEVSTNIVRQRWETCTTKVSGAIHAVPNIWQTPSLRKSGALLHARGNALRIWEKLGKRQRIKGDDSPKGRRITKRVRRGWKSE